jgi:hypothetical protein
MRRKLLTIITTLVLSGILISCSQQDEIAGKKLAQSEKAQSSKPVNAQLATPIQPTVLKEFAQEITVDSKIEKMRVKEVIEIPVSVKNTSNETWLAKNGEKSVFLAYHWRDKNDKMIVQEGIRTPLPNDIAPGSSIKLLAKVASPDQPGSYILQITMVQEFVAWFHDQGAKTLDIPVNVTE